MLVNPKSASGRKAAGNLVTRLARRIGAIALLSARRLGPAALG